MTENRYMEETKGKWRKKPMHQHRQAQVSRMEIIADLFKRGYSFRQMREETMKRLGLKTYSLETVHKDVHRLLDEWKEHRISCIDAVVQLELSRNDEIMKEAWEAWDKSKMDYERMSAKQQGKPSGGGDGNSGIETYRLEQKKEMVRKYGDPRYLELILKVEERNAKLLGYDKPLKVDVYNIAERDGVAAAGVRYDIGKLPVDLLVEAAYKLQDAEYARRQEEEYGSSEEPAAGEAGE